MPDIKCPYCGGDKFDVGDIIVPKRKGQRLNFFTRSIKWNILNMIKNRDIIPSIEARKCEGCGHVSLFVEKRS